MTATSVGSVASAAIVALVALAGCSVLDPSGSVSTTAFTTTATSTPKPVVVLQTTPEAAMTTWLKALAAGDGTTVCNLMTRGTTPYSGIPGATASCAKALVPKMAAFAEFRDRFTTLSITGATITGGRATFDDAKAEPAMAEQVIEQFDAVKVQNKWYLVPAAAAPAAPTTGAAPPATTPATRRPLPSGTISTLQ